MPLEPPIRPDLQNPDVLKALPVRKTAPYWNILAYCRNIGVFKRTARELFWVARYRDNEGRYRQHRLGATDTFDAAVGERFFTYDQAVQRADEWFADPAIRKEARPAFPVGPQRALCYTPIGDVFTIGHALQDYLEWKRMAAAESYFLTTVTMINHHLVPRIATLPAADFSGARVRDFVTEILETPPKKGNRPPEPRRPVDTFDPEEQRKRRKTANTLLGIVKGALEMAWENERLDNDRLFRRIKKLRNVDRPRVLHLTRDERRRLIDACPADFRTLVMGALYTGCRRSELMRMQAVHVGCDGYGVHVTPVKATKPRFVFLPDEGMAFFLALARGKKPNEFCSDNKAGPPENTVSGTSSTRRRNAPASSKTSRFTACATPTPASSSRPARRLSSSPISSVTPTPCRW